MSDDEEEEDDGQSEQPDGEEQHKHPSESAQNTPDLKIIGKGLTNHQKHTFARFLIDDGLNDGLFRI